MKIQKFANLVKQSRTCSVISVGRINEGQEMYLSDGHAIYKASMLPWVETKTQMCAVLGFDEGRKKETSVLFSRESSLGNVAGLNMSDADIQDDIQAEKTEVAVSLRGKQYTALSGSDGSLLFIDETFLRPLDDRFKESGYMRFCIRYIEGRQASQQYIVVMDGIECIAAIMPHKMAWEEYIPELRRFLEHCVRQQAREEAGSDWADAREEDPDDEEDNE